MPNKAVEAIKAAWEATQETVTPLSIMISPDSYQVHVSSMRDLEQIPGALEFTPFGEEYPYMAHKNLESVKFFCLLTQEEYKAARVREAS